MGIPCLIIDLNQRIGDCWRNRYFRLVLHDPVWCELSTAFFRYTKLLNVA